MPHSHFYPPPGDRFGYQGQNEDLRWWCSVRGGTAQTSMRPSSMPFMMNEGVKLSTDCDSGGKDLAGLGVTEDVSLATMK